MARKLKVRQCNITFDDNHEPNGYHAHFTHWDSAALGGIVEGIQEDIMVVVTNTKPLFASLSGDVAVEVVDACKALVNDPTYKQTFVDDVGQEDGPYQSETWDN